MSSTYCFTATFEFNWKKYVQIIFALPCTLLERTGKSGVCRCLIGKKFSLPGDELSDNADHAQHRAKRRVTSLNKLDDGQCSGEARAHHMLLQ